MWQLFQDAADEGHYVGDAESAVIVHVTDGVVEMAFEQQVNHVGHIGDADDAIAVQVTKH